MPETNPNGGVPETSASTVPSTEVSEASQTSDQANPMAEAPAEPTEAQQEQAGLPTDKPSDEALAVFREDAEWRNEHPNEARIREANPNVGGEDNSYLENVSR